MIPVNVADTVVAAFNVARLASEARRGPPTLANHGDLLVSLFDDLQAYQINRFRMPSYFRKLTEYLLYSRMQFLFRWPMPVPLGGPLFLPAEINVLPLLTNLNLWRANIALSYPSILFGQMSVNHQFQGQVNQLGAREAALAGTPLLAATPAALGYGLGCRVTVVREAGQLIVANNRTFSAHCIAGVRPLRLVFRDADPAERNRLMEVEGLGGVPVLNFTAAVPRPAGIPNPRTLPSPHMPLKNHLNPPQVIHVATVPPAWMND